MGLNIDGQERISNDPNSLSDREIVTRTTSLERIKELLRGSGNVHNASLMISIKQNLLFNNEKIKDEDRQDIANYLSQVVFLNRTVNFKLAEEMQEVLEAFQS